MAEVFWHLLSGNPDLVSGFNRDGSSNTSRSSFNNEFRKFEAERYNNILRRNIRVPHITRKQVTVPGSFDVRMPRGVRDVEMRDLLGDLTKELHKPTLLGHMSSTTKAKLLNKLKKQLAKRLSRRI